MPSGGKREGAGRPPQSALGAKVPLTVRLPVDVLAALEATAARSGETLRQTVERLLRAAR